MFFAVRRAVLISEIVINFKSVFVDTFSLRYSYRARILKGATSFGSLLIMFLKSSVVIKVANVEHCVCEGLQECNSS